jgi:hypothetical protein
MPIHGPGFMTASGEAVAVTQAMRDNAAALLATYRRQGMVPPVTFMTASAAVVMAQPAAQQHQVNTAARTKALRLLGLSRDDDDDELMRICGVGGASPAQAHATDVRVGLDVVGGVVECSLWFPVADDPMVDDAPDELDEAHEVDDLGLLESSNLSSTIMVESSKRMVANAVGSGALNELMDFDDASLLRAEASTRMHCSDDRAPPVEVDEDEDIWNEVDSAAAEVSAILRAPPPPPLSLLLDEWRRDRCPASPPLVDVQMLPSATFLTARALAERRWARLRATPANMAHLPVELYTSIFACAPLDSMARLAMCSKEWNGAAAAALCTDKLWRRVFEEHRALSHVEPKARGQEECKLQLSAVRLFSTVFCRCDDPVACAELLVKCARAAYVAERAMKVRVGSPLRANLCRLVWNNGASDVARLLCTCPRASEWTADLVSTCYFNLLPGFTLRIDDCEAADCEVHDLREMATQFAQCSSANVPFLDLLRLILTKLEPLSSDARSWLMMSAFAEFVHDYTFTVEAGTQMGSACASFGLPVADIIDIMSKVSAEESEAQEPGDEHHATVAFVRAWAAESGFPTARPIYELHAVVGAIASFDAWIKKDLLPVAVSWVHEMLAQHEGEHPRLDMALGLLNHLVLNQALV